MENIFYELKNFTSFQADYVKDGQAKESEYKELETEIKKDTNSNKTLKQLKEEIKAHNKKIDEIKRTSKKDYLQKEYTKLLLYKVSGLISSEIGLDESKSLKMAKSIVGVVGFKEAPDFLRILFKNKEFFSTLKYNNTIYFESLKNLNLNDLKEKASKIAKKNQQKMKLPTEISDFDNEEYENLTIIEIKKLIAINEVKNQQLKLIDVEDVFNELVLKEAVSRFNKTVDKKRTKVFEQFIELTLKDFEKNNYYQKPNKIILLSNRLNQLARIFSVFER